MKQLTIFMAIAMAATGGCRLLETGYGDDNAVIRKSVDTISAARGTAKSAIAWTGAQVLSFGDDLDSAQHNRFITIGEHAAAAYRVQPALPDGYRPFSEEEFAGLNLPAGRYRYEPDTGFVEDAGGIGFGARISHTENKGEVVIAFRGSNSPGEDEHWMQDWIVDAHQSGGGTPAQYLYGAEVLSEVRRAFPDSNLTITGHSLGGGIAAYATMKLSEPKQLICATYNAAGISSITLLSIPKDVLAEKASRIFNIRSKGDPVSAIPGTQLIGKIYEVDNLRFANHPIDGLLIDMRRRAEGRRAGWLRDLFDD